MRTRYTYAGAVVVNGRKRYIWYGPRLRGDSRSEQITVDAQWFWGPR